jgi:threonine dehydratase
VEPTLEARDAAAHAAVAAAGLARFVHPSNDPDVMSGQGTVALELLEQAGQPLDAVLVPVGGGGLLSGVAMAVKVSYRAASRCGCGPG